MHQAFAGVAFITSRYSPGRHLLTAHGLPRSGNEPAQLLSTVSKSLGRRRRSPFSSPSPLPRFG
jgi:hypothetical protein